MGEARNFLVKSPKDMIEHYGGWNNARMHRRWICLD